MLILAFCLAYTSRAIPEITALYGETPYLDYGWRIFLTRLLIIAAVTITLLSAGLTGFLYLPSWQLSIFLLSYLALVVASILASSYYFASVQAAFNTCLWCSGFFITAHLCRSPKKQQWFIFSVYILAFAMATYGILQLLGYYPKYLKLYGSVEGFYYQSNHYAGFLDLVIPITLAGILYYKRWYFKGMLLLLLILLVVNLVETHSRGSWFAMGIVCLGLLIVWLKQKWRSVLYVLITLLLLSGGGLIYNLYSIKSYFEKPAVAMLDGSLQQRLVLWQVSLVAIKERPWLGWGAGRFIEIAANYRSALSITELEPLLDIIMTYAHSDYIQIALETGLPSLMAFVLFWLTTLLTFKARIPPRFTIHYGIAAGLTALLLHSFIEGNLSIIPATAFLSYSLAGFLHAQPQKRLTSD